MKYFFVILLFISYSCCTQERCAKKYPPLVQTKDSSYTKIEIKYRDTIVYTPVDSNAIKAEVFCDKNGKAQLPLITNQSTHSSSSIFIKDGKLQSNCKCDSTAIQLKIKEQYESQYREKTKVIKILHIIKKKVIDWRLVIVAFILGIFTAIIFRVIKWKM